MQILTRYPSAGLSSIAPTPWALYSWPPVSWRIDPPREGPRFKHLSTRIARVADGSGLRSGPTVWGSLCDDGHAGLAWDWEEIARGVIAMADPTHVVSNLRLLDAHGEALTATAAALHFNHFVADLPWQDEVIRILGI